MIWQILRLVAVMPDLASEAFILRAPLRPRLDQGYYSAVTTFVLDEMPRLH